MKDKFNGKAPIPFKQVCDEISEKFRLVNPESDIKFLADPRIGTNFFEERFSDMYDHIFDPNSGRSYRELYGQKAAEQFCEHIANNSVDIQVDDTFEFAMAGSISGTGIRTRESALSGDNALMGEYLQLSQNTMIRLKEAEAAVARENSNHNIGDISQNAQKQKQEEKAATENAKKDNETNIRIQQEVEQQRQIYEQQRISQLAADELKHSEEILAEQAKYEEIKREEQRIYTEEQTKIQEKYEADIKESQYKYEESLKEYEKVREEYQQAQSNESLSNDELSKIKESYEKQESAYKEAEIKYQETEKQASIDKEQRMAQLDESRKTSVDAIEFSHSAEISRIEASHNIEAMKINESFNREFREKEQEIIAKYDDSSSSKSSYNTSSDSSFNLGDSNLSYIEQIQARAAEMSLEQSKVATGYNVSSDSSNILTQERSYTSDFSDSMDEALRQSKSNSISLAYGSPEGTKEGSSSLDTGRMLSDAAREHGSSDLNNDSFRDAERMSAAANSASLDAINKLNNENASQHESSTTPQGSYKEQTSYSSHKMNEAEPFVSKPSNGFDSTHVEPEQRSYGSEQKSSYSTEQKTQEQSGFDSHGTTANKTEEIDYISRFSQFLQKEHPGVFEKYSSPDVSDAAQREYVDKYGTDAQKERLDYNYYVDNAIISAADKTGFGGVGEALSYVFLMRDTAQRLHEVFSHSDSQYDATGKDEIMSAIDKFNDTTAQAYNSAKSNSAEYTVENYNKIAMDRAVDAYKQNNPLGAAVLETYTGDATSKRIESSMRLSDGLDDFITETINGTGATKTSTTADINIGKLDKATTQTNAQAIKAFSDAMSTASVLSDSASQMTRKLIHSARVGQMENMEGTVYMQRLVTPVFMESVGLMRKFAAYNSAVRELNGMDFEKMGNLIRATGSTSGIKVLSDAELKNFGKETFIDLKRGSESSAKMLRDIKAQMYEKYAKNGGTIYAQKDLSVAELRKRAKEIQKQLKTATGTQAKELQDELATMSLLRVGAKVEAFNFVEVTKQLKHIGIIGVSMMLSGTTDDTGRTMVNFGTSIYRNTRMATNFGKKVHKAIKNSQKAIEATKKLTDSKTLMNAGRTLAKGTKATINTSRKVANTAANKAVNLTAKGTKTIARKATRKIGSKAVRTIGRTTSKILTRASKIGARFIGSGSKIGSAIAHANAFINSLSTSASLMSAGGATATAAGTTVAAGGAGAAVGTTTGATVGAVGGAAGVFSGPVGWIILAVVLIILIIVCIFCCLCSSGAQYETYSSVDAFYVAKDGTSGDAEKSLAMYTMAFMSTHFEENYETFIFNGVENHIDTILELAKGAGVEYIVPEYDGLVSHEKGRLTYVKIDDDPEVFGHFVFVMGPNSIYYNDVDHFLNYSIANYEIEIDPDNPTQYIVTYTDYGVETDGKESKSRIYNEKEILAMSSVLLQNDYSMDVSYTNTSSTRTFEAYSFSMWLSSHYCVVDEDDVKWYEKAINWIVELFENLVASIFGDNQAKQVEEYYLGYVYNGDEAATADDDKFIKLVSIKFEWDDSVDEKDYPNWIIALNENEYCPEAYHYLGTPLKFESLPSGADKFESDIFSNSNRKDYITLNSTWQKSQYTYAESIKINESHEVEQVGTKSTINNSVFMTKELTVAYKYSKYTTDNAAITTAIDNWVQTQVDNANNSCTCNTFLGYEEDDNLLDSIFPDAIYGCACSSCSCEADADEATREEAKSRWTEAIDDYTTEDSLVSAGFIDLDEYEDGYLFDTETSSKDAAKAEAEAIVNDLYDHIEEYFGVVEDEDRGELLLDAVGAYSAVSSTKVEITSGEETEEKTITYASVDSTKVPELFQPGTKDGAEYYNTSCLQIRIPYGEGYIGETDGVKQGYTTREDALEMIRLAYEEADTKAAETGGDPSYLKTYRDKKTIKYSGTYGTYDFGVTTAEKKTYIMLFAPKSYVLKSANSTSGLVIKYTDLYKQYFICGGHTKLAIEPVVLTYSGSETMFDIDTVRTNYGLDEVSKNFINLKFLDPETQDVAESIWQLSDDNPISRENILTALKMVDANWEQKYEFEYSDVDLEDTLGNEIEIEDGQKFIDYVTYSLYQTEAEREKVAEKLGNAATYSANTYDKMAMQQSIESMSQTITESLLASNSALDVNGDGLINKEDYDDAIEAGNTALANQITSAINRLDRCVLALNLVGKVGYSQTCHDYVVSGPLKKYWSYNNPSVPNNELADLLTSGDEYDAGLVYKTDCSGFVSYILGIDNAVSTSAIYTSSSITVALPDIRETAEKFEDDWTKVDPILRCIYNDGANTSITYTHVNVDWSSPPSNIKPGDAVAKNGHVMLYLGPASESTYWFAECTGVSKLGPGGVVLKERSGAKLNEDGYNGAIVVDYDVRLINFTIDR